MPPICQQLQMGYQTLKSKKQEFDSAYEKAKSTDNAEDMREARKLMEELKEKRNILEELLWPFHEFFKEKLKHQYEFAMSSYREFGLFETLSHGEEGIKYKTEDGQIKEYAIPSLQEIIKSLKQNKEFWVYLVKWNRAN